MKTHKDGITPTNGEVFVFGSNLNGIHGAGAAKEARNNFGAKMGHGVGRCGMSYAIPTKDKHMNTMTVDAIKPHIEDFIIHAKMKPNETFFLTRVGCGLAGHKDKDIAPLFEDIPDNVVVPEQWALHIKEARKAK